MDAERGPGASRGVPGIAPPVRRIHFAEIAVADIGVHVQQAAEAAGLEQPAHFLHRWLIASLVPDAEYAASLGAGRENPLGARGIERQRFLAEHLFARGEGRNGHFLM